MKRTHWNITFFGFVIAASTIAFYVWHQQVLTTGFVAENSRLRTVITDELLRFTIPQGAKFIYQETSADRICKLASITRLISSTRTPKEFCGELYESLSSSGWKIPYGCKSINYPTSGLGTRAPADKDKEAYDYLSLIASTASGKVRVNITALPRDFWGHHFIVSEFGEKHALPLARDNGETIATIKLDYMEDHATFRLHCPDDATKCECFSSLYTWKFPNGKSFLRSN